MGYQILVDSCGDLTEGMKRNRKIRRVPLHIRVGKREYVDDENLDCRELLEDIAHSGLMPASACPSPGEYADACDREADRIYIVTGSSALSGSYNSACLAQKLMQEERDVKGDGPGQEICVIDSRSASAGELLLVRQIIQHENRGVPMETIVSGIKNEIKNMRTRFVLEDLTILERSGRLTGLKARFADALHICPVLSSTEEGTICQTGQARGIKRAVSVMLRRIGEDAKEKEIRRIAISHCMQEEMANDVRRKLKNRFPHASVALVETGGIPGMYAGKGGIIVAYV